MFGSKKTPGQQIISSDNKIQKYRDERSKLDRSDPSFEKKDKKLMGKIHQENVKIDVAKRELNQPLTNNTTVNKKTTINANFSANKTENGVHIHGHYHSSGKKKK